MNLSGYPQVEKLLNPMQKIWQVQQEKAKKIQGHEVIFIYISVLRQYGRMILTHF